MRTISGDRGDQAVQFITFLLLILHMYHSLCNTKSTFVVTDNRDIFATQYTKSELDFTNMKLAIYVKTAVRFTLSFFTRDSIARLLKPSLSPPWRWHINECTMLKQASALVGALGAIPVISLTVLKK